MDRVAAEELKLLRAQNDLYRQRMKAARDQLEHAQSTLDHVSFAIVREETKRTALLAAHQLQRWLEQDQARFSALDNLPV